MNEGQDQKKSKLTPILVAVSIAVALILFIVFYSICRPASQRKSTSTFFNNEAVIRDVCKASRDPSACASALSAEWKKGGGGGGGGGDTATPVVQAIGATLRVSSHHLNTSLQMLTEILDGSADNANRSDTSKVCLEILRYGDYRSGMAAEALPHGRIKDARAWMSAVLAYEYGCMSGLKNVNDTRLVVDAITFFNSSLVPSTIDVLSMMANYDYFGEETGSWAPPKTERDGFWGTGSVPRGGGGGGAVVGGGVPSGMAHNVTVCGGGGGCDYEKVQEAVVAAPDNSGARFVIWIKEGVYNETVRVPFEKKNVVLLGDGMGKTVITGSMNVGQPRVSTYNSATVGVLGDGFMASNLTIENTAGVDAHQAVAFRSDSDLSILEYCEFLGNQDTLYAHSLRQFYKSCLIQGNIDFIFGQSASLFQDCEILVAPQQTDPKKSENNAITAHGRINPAQSTGFVFQNCLINGTDAYMAMYSSNPDIHKTYLGRPWKEYSRTVFLGCTMEGLISADGWMPWSGDFALKTLYYGEFENKGPGAETGKRVNWSSVVPAEHVGLYSVENFIQGDQWIPAAST